MCGIMSDVCGYLLLSYVQGEEKVNFMVMCGRF